MRHKNRRWLFVWAVMCSIMGILECELMKNSTNTVRQSSENAKNATKAHAAPFSPRMDYEQWTPIGRGDPLKNDPTYDYVPPILEHVHYWVDPSSRRPDPQLEASQEMQGEAASAPKTEILVLGVSSKKPSVQSSSFKFPENAPKFAQNHYQRERIYFPSSYYYPPSSGYYKTKYERFKAPAQSQIPYTILMPPPLPRTEGALRVTTESGTDMQDIQVQAGNLVYHASTVSNSIRDAHDEESYHTADSTSVTWRTPLVNPHQPPNKRPLIGQLASSPRPETMYKMGKVENAHMDAINTYVSIGKPEAHIQPEIAIPSSNLNLINLLKKEVLQKDVDLNPNIPSTIASFLANIPKATMTTATTSTTTPLPPLPPQPTTTTQTLTTDPLFKHYKQPAEPLRGPMYLIIQGHSKVKTYGPSKQLFGISVQDLNEIPNHEKDAYKDFPVKHLHAYRRKDEYQPIGRTMNARGRALDPGRVRLVDVVQTGYGAIAGITAGRDQATIATDHFDMDLAHADTDIKETDLVAKFQVAADSSSQEEYHKGIVEEVTRET